MSSRITSDYSSQSTSATSTTATSTSIANSPSKNTPKKHRDSAPAILSVEKRQADSPNLNLNLGQLSRSSTNDGTKNSPSSPFSPEHSDPRLTSPRRVQITGGDRDGSTVRSPLSPRSARGFKEETMPGLKRRLDFSKKTEATDLAQASAPAVISPDKKSVLYRNSAPAAMLRMTTLKSDARLGPCAIELGKIIIKTMRSEAKPHHPKNTSSASSSCTTNSLVATNNMLTTTVINAFGRTEIEVKEADCSTEMLGLLSSVQCRAGKSRNKANDASIFGHDLMIKAIFSESVATSAAGKTLLTMKRVVMEGPELKELTMTEVLGDAEKKQAGIASMKLQAEACVAMTFGIGDRSLANSKLPPELFICWKEMDRNLVQWAQENPALTAEDIKTARSNLGFDLIMTRLVYPLITPDQEEAKLAAPTWFLNAVRGAHLAAWPSFFADFEKISATAPIQLVPVSDLPEKEKEKEKN